MVIDKSVWSFIDRNTIMTVIYHLNSQTYSLVISNYNIYFCSGKSEMVAVLKMTNPTKSSLLFFVKL